MQRAGDALTATLPLTLPTAYAFRITVGDPDGVQFGSLLTPSVVVSGTLQPRQVFLPLVRR